MLNQHLYFRSLGRWYPSTQISQFDGIAWVKGKKAYFYPRALTAKMVSFLWPIFSARSLSNAPISAWLVSGSALYVWRFRVHTWRHFYSSFSDHFLDPLPPWGSASCGITRMAQKREPLQGLRQQAGQAGHFFVISSYIYKSCMRVLPYSVR